MVLHWIVLDILVDLALFGAFLAGVLAERRGWTRVRLYPFILVLLLGLVGCASVPVVKPTTADWSADNAQCRDLTKDLTVSGLRKTLIYSSNILVIPVTTALTLGFGTIYVYPQSDIEWQAYHYQQCMKTLGY